MCFGRFATALSMAAADAFMRRAQTSWVDRCCSASVSSTGGGGGWTSTSKISQGADMSKPSSSSSSSPAKVTGSSGSTSKTGIVMGQPLLSASPSTFRVQAARCHVDAVALKLRNEDAI